LKNIRSIEDFDSLLTECVNEIIECEKFLVAYEKAEEDFIYVYNTYVKHEESNQIFNSYYSELKNIRSIEDFDSLLTECVNEIIECEEFLVAYEKAEEDFVYVYETFVKHEESKEIFNIYYSELKNIRSIEDFNTLINECVDEINKYEEFLDAYDKAEDDFASLYQNYASNESAKKIIDTYYNELQSIGRTEDFESLVDACCSELLQVSGSVSMEDVVIPVRATEENSNADVNETKETFVAAAEIEDETETEAVVDTTADNNDVEPTYTADVGGFVTRCYNVALNREPEQAGYDYWTELLIGGQKHGGEVGLGFIFSEEYTNKNTSNEQFVTDLYTMFFGREADVEGFNYWVGKLNAGEERVSIFAGFVFSEEFANLCQAYGIYA
ncbi:MAG: DUF4214 domain-containing protein, partial [Clostridia bacterium]|nr:DUF4214 domain-containing protein [Clostridia bacterium]